MLVLEILGCWLIGSFTLGPLLAWVFFYPVRRQEKNHANRNLCESLDKVVCLRTTCRGSQVILSNPNGQSCKQGNHNELAFGLETLRG
jgi:hypothetical protein